MRFVFPMKVMPWSTLETDEGEKLKPGAEMWPAGRSFRNATIERSVAKRKFDMDLTLPFPPSVNSYLKKRGRRMVLSAEARAYYDHVKLIVCGSVRKMDRPVRGPLELVMVARPPDQKERDLDNLLKVAIDSIQRAGLIVDDSQVCHIDIRWGRCCVRGSIDLNLRVMNDSELVGRAWPGRKRRDRR